MSNEDSVIKSLNKRQAAIKKISVSASFKSRKTVVNGILNIQINLHAACGGRL